FLIKQEWPDSVQEYNTFTYSRYCSYPDKSTRNNNYLVNLRLKQNWSANDFNNDGALTTIRTDLKDYNIKATYCYSAGGNNYSTTVGDSLSAADIMGLTDLSGKKKTEFIYKVTVKAYEGKFEGRERDENKVKCELSATTQ
ncbi:MAG: hypothetical protein K5644_08670, partial [Lachnospiraceae bacterium]|nr:hypothetical protein [Lachnospiraceae bacterium]